MQRVDRSLTTEGFARLLRCFDDDSKRASEKYQLICRDLNKFFECRGCYTPRELVDETINRVAHKIAMGEQIPTNALSGYFYGVARNVLREFVRSPEQKAASIELLPPTQHPTFNPTEINQRQQEKIRMEQQMDCLDQCINELSPESRTLILSYYEGDEGIKIENRRMLAEALNIPINNLRIRIHRIREKLEKCLKDCIAKSEPE